MDRKRGVVALLVACTGMGLSGLLNRGATRVDFLSGDALIAGQSIGAFMTVGRMAMGVLLFAALLLISGKLGLFRRTRLSASIVAGGLAVGVSFAFYMVSSLLTTLANSVFLIYTGPLFCAVLARFFRKEPISPFQGACLAAVFAGMLLISGVVSFGPGGVSLGFSTAPTPEFPQKPLGDAFGLLSGAFYGLSLFFNGYRKDCDTTVRGVWNFLFATAGSLAVALAMTGAWPLGVVAASPVNGLFMVLLWVICGPVGIGLLLVAGRNLPAVEYSTISYWECIVSVAASVLVFGEALDGPTIAGGLLIFVGGALPAISTLRSAAR